MFINLSLLCNPQFADTVILNCLDYGLIRVCTSQCLTAGHFHDTSNGDNSLNMDISVYCSLRLQMCLARVYRFFRIECSCHSSTQVSCCLYARFFLCWEMENDWPEGEIHNELLIWSMVGQKKVFCRYRDNEVLGMLCVVWLTSLVFKKHLLCILKQYYFEPVPCNKGRCTVHKLQSSWRKQTSDIFHSSP